MILVGQFEDWGPQIKPSTTRQLFCTIVLQPNLIAYFLDKYLHLYYQKWSKRFFTCFWIELYLIKVYFQNGFHRFYLVQWKFDILSLTPHVTTILFQFPAQSKTSIRDYLFSCSKSAYGLWGVHIHIFGLIWNKETDITILILLIHK